MSPSIGDEHMKTKFSKDSFKYWVEQAIHDTEAHIKENSDSVIVSRMEGKLNSHGCITEKMQGISYLEALRALSLKIESKWEEIHSSLEQIVDSVFVKENCVLHLAADLKTMHKWEYIASGFINQLPTSSSQFLGHQLSIFSSHSAGTNVLLPQTNEAIIIPTRVNFVGRATKVSETGYSVDGSALVITELVRRILWDHVRVRNGAYDITCQLNIYSGVLSFVSGRDSNIFKTLNVYEKIPDFLYKLEADDDCLKKTVFKKIKYLEDEIYPSYGVAYDNFLRYLSEITYMDRLKIRQEMLSTSLSNIKDFADALEACKETSVAVVIGCSHDIGVAHEQQPDFFEIKRII